MAQAAGLAEKDGEFSRVEVESILNVLSSIEGVVDTKINNLLVLIKQKKLS